MLAVIIIAIILILSAKASSYQTQNVTNEQPQQESFVSAEPIKFLTPVKGGEILKDYSDTALQYSKTLNQWEAHKAIDFLAEEGADVYAVLDGTVTEVSYNYLMGNIIKLDVGDGITVVYKNLSNEIPVKVNDKVKKGDVIGYVGKTAKSESSDVAHLHFETYLKDKSVNPNDYLDLKK